MKLYLNGVINKRLESGHLLYKNKIVQIWILYVIKMVSYWKDNKINGNFSIHHIKIAQLIKGHFTNNK